MALYASWQLHACNSYVFKTATKCFHLHCAQSWIFSYQGINTLTYISDLQLCRLHSCANVLAHAAALGTSHGSHFWPKYIFLFPGGTALFFVH